MGRRHSLRNTADASRMKIRLYVLYIYLFLAVFILASDVPYFQLHDTRNSIISQTPISDPISLNITEAFKYSSNYKNYIIKKYANRKPKEWGEKVTGVETAIKTHKKVIALTFDACGGKHGSGFDRKLIDFLIQNKIPATLFINSRWIDANFKTFVSLSQNPLFEIENHGYKHKPLSVNGKSAYKIKGTSNVLQVVDEVMSGEDKIFRITGRKPMFFRPGTAFCDEIGVKITNELGEKVVGFNVLGDAGATFSKNQIINACIKAKPGSIIICHMNHPEKSTAEGIKSVVPMLLKKGFRFVKLEDQILTHQ